MFSRHDVQYALVASQTSRCRILAITSGWHSRLLLYITGHRGGGWNNAGGCGCHLDSNGPLLHTFNGPLSGTTQVSQYQKGKTSLDFTEARDSEWQWHQLGHMQVCTSLQTGNHASTPPLSFFTGRMPFLLPNQQHQSTEGIMGH